MSVGLSLPSDRQTMWRSSWVKFGVGRQCEGSPRLHMAFLEASVLCPRKQAASLPFHREAREGGTPLPRACMASSSEPPRLKFRTKSPWDHTRQCHSCGLRNQRSIFGIGNLLWRQKQGNILELKSSPVYIKSSRPAKVHSETLS